MEGERVSSRIWTALIKAASFGACHLSCCTGYRLVYLAVDQEVEQIGELRNGHRVQQWREPSHLGVRPRASLNVSHTILGTLAHALDVPRALRDFGVDIATVVPLFRLRSSPVLDG